MYKSFWDNLAVTPKAQPAPEYPYSGPVNEEGKIPMKTYTDNVAVATVTSPLSETAIQRKYLLERFTDTYNRWPTAGAVERKIDKMFNINVFNEPKTGKELIERIKAGDYTLDEKRIEKFEKQQANQDAGDYDDDDYDFDRNYAHPFLGLTWNGPKPDYKGRDEALKEFAKAKQDVKDIIIVKSPEEALDAIKALADWMPSNAPKQ